METLESGLWRKAFLVLEGSMFQRTASRITTFSNPEPKSAKSHNIIAFRDGYLEKRIHVANFSQWHQEKASSKAFLSYSYLPNTTPWVIIRTGVGFSSLGFYYCPWFSLFPTLGYYPALGFLFFPTLGYYSALGFNFFPPLATI